MALRVLAIPGRGGLRAGQTLYLSEQEGGERLSGSHLLGHREEGGR